MLTSFLRTVEHFLYSIFYIFGALLIFACALILFASAIVTVDQIYVWLKFGSLPKRDLSWFYEVLNCGKLSSVYSSGSYFADKCQFSKPPISDWVGLNKLLIQFFELHILFSAVLLSVLIGLIYMAALIWMEPFIDNDSIRTASVHSEPTSDNSWSFKKKSDDYPNDIGVRCQKFIKQSKANPKEYRALRDEALSLRKLIESDDERDIATLWIIRLCMFANDKSYARKLVKQFKLDQNEEEALEEFPVLRSHKEI